MMMLILMIVMTLIIVNIGIEVPIRRCAHRTESPHTTPGVRQLPISQAQRVQSLRTQSDAGLRFPPTPEFDSGLSLKLNRVGLLECNQKR